MEEIYWECFFNNAGINGLTSKEYAAIFVKNKISDTILPHLNESYLKSMGIEAIGDVIRVLKYSKDFLEEKKLPPKVTKETKERRVEIFPHKTQLNEDKPITKKITSSIVHNVLINPTSLVSSTYTKPPGCELPVAVKRIVTPEIEGRYKIKYPSKSPIAGDRQQIQKSEQPKPSTKAISTSNRIVLLNDSSHFNTEKKISVLKRLGMSNEKLILSSSSDEEEKKDNRKKQKIDISDKITLSSRFKNATIANADRGLKINTSSKSSVFERLGETLRREESSSDASAGKFRESTSGSGIFRSPVIDKVKIRSGHTTVLSQKMEATSTTEVGSLRSDSAKQSLSKHVLRRLGRKL